MLLRLSLTPSAASRGRLEGGWLEPRLWGTLALSHQKALLLF